MLPVTRQFVLLIACVTAAACGGGSGDDDHAPALLPGSVIVASRDIHVSGGIGHFGPVDLEVHGDDVALLLGFGSTTFFEHSTGDVISDPGGVGAYYDSVSTPGGSLSDGGYEIALSHDRGRTWSVHPVPGFVSGVHFVGERLFVVLAFWLEVSRTTRIEYEIHELFADTDTLGPMVGRRIISETGNIGFHQVALVGDKAIAFQMNFDMTADLAHGPSLYPDVKAGTLDWMQIDLVTGEVLAKQQPFTNAQGRDLAGLPFYRDKVGDTYWRFARSTTDGGTHSCLASVSMAFATGTGGPTLLPSPRCWPALDVPPFFAGLAITDAGVLQTWWEHGDDGDEAWAMRLQQGRPEAVYLGPGRPVSSYPNGARHLPYDGLVEIHVPLDENGNYRARFVRVPPEGPAVEIPLVVPGELPGYHPGYVPRLAASFGGTEWLTVFSTTTYRDPLYGVGPIGWVITRTESHAPETPVGPKARDRRFPGCKSREPGPATGVDEACVKHVSECRADTFFHLGFCVRDLLIATPEARAAFVAAPTQCGPWVAPTRGAPATACEPPLGTAHCDGDAVIECFGNLDVLDCSALGLTCEPSPEGLVADGGASCGSTECPRPRESAEHHGWCNGDWLVFPSSGATDRAVDCRALGYATCAPGQGEYYSPYCTGTAPPSTEGVLAGDFERACALAVMCGALPYSLSECIDALIGGSWPAIDDAHDPWFNALIAARSCDALAAALAARFTPDSVAADCATAVTTPRCVDGGVCHANDTFEDCPARGLACHDAGQGSFGCGQMVFGCVEGGAMCVLETEVACTDDNVGVARTHCGWLPGFHCDTAVGCAADAVDPACAADPAATCDGDTLQYCYQGSLRTLDCAAIGGACKVTNVRATCAPR